MLGRARHRCSDVRVNGVNDFNFLRNVHESELLDHGVRDDRKNQLERITDS